MVIARAVEAGQALLDIGAGDGRRALHIARGIGAREVVLLEPSVKMREFSEANFEIWPIRAEELSTFARGRKFGVITCLWNVLGHIPEDKRRDVLEQCGRMLTPDGMFFLDVNHRYNMRAYGFWRTTGRMLYDRIMPGSSHGDVVMRWNVGSEMCSAYGHVFTQDEMRTLIVEAGLEIQEKIFVDYENGEIRRSGFQGNLFYSLRRAA